MRSPEKIPSFEKSPEVMKVPEVEIREEKGPLLLSLLLRGYDREWEKGGSEEEDLKNETAKKIDEFFKNNPLDENSNGFREEIEVFKEGGVKEETLYNLALAYDRPEREDHLFKDIEIHKGQIKDPRGIGVKLIEELKKMENALPKPLKNRIAEEARKDIEARKEGVDEIKRRFKDIIDFFKPYAKATPVDKVTIVPTCPFCPERTGGSFQFDNELILQPRVEDRKGVEYEFLRPIINPIVEKLEGKLTKEQKKKIVEMGSYDLRVEQGYGDDHASLLREEFIRTYNDLIRDVKTPETYEDFQKKLKGPDKTVFAELMKKKSLEDHCKKMNISTVEDLRKKSRELYERFEKNELREIAFLFYQKYIHEREENEEIVFQDFLLKNFPKEI